MQNIRNQFLKLPKADIHNHLHLGGTKQRFAQQYPNSTFTIPNSYNGLEGMIDFIYNNLNTVMTTKKEVITFMEMAIESSIDDNVTLLEASVDIGLARFFDNSIEAVIDAVIDLKSKYSSQIIFNPDIGINKDLSLDKVYSDGIACIKSGVFNGVDLYGKEANKNLKPFKELLVSAKELNHKTKVHIGEFSDHFSIEEVIRTLKPDELQHGIRAVDSERTMDLILENNIQLNICTQSNIALGASNDLEMHPIRKLFDHGIKITLNTDDLLLFHKTITDQFVDLHKATIFSFEELDTIRLNAFN